MNLVACITSFNDKAALKECIAALQLQTYPIGEIVVVDSRSTDGTQLEKYPDSVTFLCSLRNRGVSGAAATGFEYAIRNNYGWVWVLDQDSVPRNDALSKLIEFYKNFPSEVQNHIGIISSLCLSAGVDKEVHGALLSRWGKKLPKIDYQKAYYECDAPIWSGSLYNLSAVQKVGYPCFDVTDWRNGFGGMDWADLEFGFRIKRAGYKVFVHRYSVIDHMVGNTSRRWLGWKCCATHPPDRLYVRYRNMVYFWLYLHPDRYLLPIVLDIGRALFKEVVKIVLLDRDRSAKVGACLRGAWNGWRRQFTFYS